MQADFTLAVDELNNGSTVNHAYTKFDVVGNKATYIGPSHSVAVRNKCELYRTLPTQSGNYKGTLKSTVKFTIDRTVEGVDGNDIVAPQIYEVSCSNPVGVTVAQTLLARQIILAMMDHEAVMADLNNLGEI
jgi:hypothetical protein